MATTATSSVDKIYVLKKRQTPLTYMLASRNTRRSPLLHFDGKYNRPLRYAVNQKSPFEDEQDGNAILEPIVFVDGALKVSKNNPVLQQFLDLHPSNGEVFEEVNTERDASADLENLTSELDAQLAARDLDIDSLEAVGRVLLGAKVEKMSSAELKRDVFIYARNHPSSFLEMLNDPMLQLRNTCAKFFTYDVLKLKNKGRDIYFNLPQNKKKLLTVPYGENHIYILASYLQTDEGIEVLRLLEGKIE
jgi:hypothetical protein